MEYFVAAALDRGDPGHYLSRSPALGWVTREDLGIGVDAGFCGAYKRGPSGAEAGAGLGDC